MGVGCGWCSHGSWCQWSTKITTYMAFGYHASFIKNGNCELFISQFGLLFLELRVYILQFRLYQNCEINSQLQEIKVRTVRWKKVTITLYPLYSMAEISFHRFHMCKREKQTNKHKNAQSSTHSYPLPYLFFSLFLIQLLLSLLQLLRDFFSLSDSLCCSASTNQFKEVFFTLLM